MTAYLYAGEYIEGIFTNAGVAQIGLAVTIKDSTNTTNITLYTTRTKAATTANPVSTDSYGNLVFFADPGRYRANATIAGTARTWDVIVYPDTEGVGHVFNALDDAGATATLKLQNTIDRCSTAGGGIVDAPGLWDNVTQIVIKRYVHLRGWGHQSFGSAGTVSRIHQASGINDSLIKFEEGTTASYAGPAGISDFVLLGNAADTAGHGIHTITSGGSKIKIQDLTTIERLQVRNFPGDGIRIEGGSPLNLRHVATLFNGGFGVRLIDDAVGDFKDWQQATIYDLSGDGNLGGATLRCEGLTAESLLTICGLKCEQRGNTDRGGAVANQHCISFHNCAGRVDIRGMYLLSNGTAGGATETLKPGHMIVVTGTTRPTIDISAHHVRVLPAQVNTGTSPLVSVAADPVLIDDQVGATKQVPTTVDRVLYGTAPTLAVDGIGDNDHLVVGGSAKEGSAVGSPAVSIVGGTPAVLLFETDGAADKKYWGLVASGGALTWRTYTDAGAAGESFVSVARTGTDVTNVVFASAVEIDGDLDHDGTHLSFRGLPRTPMPTAYTQTYATASRTHAAYTADVESTAYTGAIDGEAKLADLNALRVAYENLRAAYESTSQVLNAMIDDRQADGLAQ